MSNLLSAANKKYKVEIQYVEKQDKKGNSNFYVLSEERLRYLSDQNYDNIETLKTWWKVFTYKDEIDALKYSSEVIDAPNGQIVNVKNEKKYNFWLLSHCLQSWDLEVDGEPVSVQENILLQLPYNIATALVEKYKEVISPREEDLKN